MTLKVKYNLFGDLIAMQTVKQALKRNIQYGDFIRLKRKFNSNKNFCKIENRKKPK